MTATLRDHATSGMMVALSKGVECSAKIAMTALPSRRVTTRLLPEHDLRRRIFLVDHGDRRFVHHELGNGNPVDAESKRPPMESASAMAFGNSTATAAGWN